LFDRRGCLLALGGFLLVTGVSYGLMMLVCWALASVLRGLLPQDVLLFVLVLVGILLWCLFSLGAAKVLFSVRRRREAARRRRFEERPELTDEEFSRLFPSGLAPITAAVRAELERFTGRAEVARRLLQADPLRATCDLVGVCPDDLDWAEFLRGLEARFGIRLPDEAYREATVAELVTGCAGAAASPT
jgi:hypothetical protein